MSSFKHSKITDCQLVHLPKINQERGTISVVQNQKEVPFNVKRVYYLYDIPNGSERGGHAHINLKQLILAASGSFDLVIDDGESKIIFSLNSPSVGVLMPTGLWRELTNFSSGAICLVLASEEYDENDYIREYDVYKKKKTAK
jgi:hypothetical protein